MKLAISEKSALRNYSLDDALRRTNSVTFLKFCDLKQEGNLARKRKSLKTRLWRLFSVNIVVRTPKISGRFAKLYAQLERPRPVLASAPNYSPVRLQTGFAVSDANLRAGRQVHWRQY